MNKSSVEGCRQRARRMKETRGRSPAFCGKKDGLCTAAVAVLHLARVVSGCKSKRGTAGLGVVSDSSRALLLLGVVGGQRPKRHGVRREGDFAHIWPAVGPRMASHAAAHSHVDAALPCQRATHRRLLHMVRLSEAGGEASSVGCSWGWASETAQSRVDLTDLT